MMKASSAKSRPQLLARRGLVAERLIPSSSRFAAPRIRPTRQANSPWLALPPRRASNWGLLFALLAFIIYYNLLNLSQAWVTNGRLNMVAAIVGLHGGAFLVALFMIWWRDHANVVHPLQRLMRGIGR